MPPHHYSPENPAAWWSIESPASASGAVGIIALHAADGPSLDHLLTRLALPALAPGEARLVNLLGIDQGLLVRATPHNALLMPHGGTVIVRQLAAALTAAGLQHRDTPAYPEAATAAEQRTLDLLARAASPLAIEILLTPTHAAPIDEIQRQRLIDPPLVVLLGQPNIGKSTLVNALAGRHVSLVADEPGTTRDHVGVMINLAGLVVRLADLPGIATPRTDIDARAKALALDLAQHADLVLLCGDAHHPPPAPPAHGRVIVAALRTDLGRAPWPAEVHICARQGVGLVELAEAIRRTLLPTLSPAPTPAKPPHL